MNAIALVNFASFAFALTAVFFVWWRLVQSVNVAEFRADLFALRRRLFLVMVDRNLDPSTPGYVRVRSLMNGLLSKAEDITPFNVIMWLAASEIAPIEVRSLTDLVDQVDDVDARRELVFVHNLVGRAILNHLRRMTWTSPTLWLAIGLSGAAKAKQRLGQVVEANGALHGAVAA